MRCDVEWLRITDAWTSESALVKNEYTATDRRPLNGKERQIKDWIGRGMAKKALAKMLGVTEAALYRKIKLLRNKGFL
jgi:hypothetical protein